jgi:hypothetical protein
MVMRQGFHGQCVWDGHEQRQQTFARHGRFDVLWCIELAQRSLDADFPDHGRRNIDCVLASSIGV